MATLTFVSLICDDCGKEEIPPNSLDAPKTPTTFVNSHSVTVDGYAAELEICEECWPQLTVVRVAEIGRKVRGRR